MSCVFSWNCGDLVLTLIQGWLESPFSDSDSENSNSKKKGKKSKKSASENSPDHSEDGSQNSEAMLGLRLLNALLVPNFSICLTKQAEESTRLGMLTYSQQTIQLMKTLLQYFVLVQKKMYNEDSVPLEGELLLSALTTYCKLFVHITASFDELEKDTDPLKELIQWVEEIVVPAISSTYFFFEINNHS